MLMGVKHTVLVAVFNGAINSLWLSSCSIIMASTNVNRRDDRTIRRCEQTFKGGLLCLMILHLSSVVINAATNIQRQVSFGEPIETAFCRRHANVA